MYEETVSVEELFEEELAAIIEARQSLVEKGDRESILVADSLNHVIQYFKVRLGYEDIEMDEFYGISEDITYH